MTYQEIILVCLAVTSILQLVFLFAILKGIATLSAQLERQHVTIHKWLVETNNNLVELQDRKEEDA